MTSTFVPHFILFKENDLCDSKSKSYALNIYCAWVVIITCGWGTYCVAKLAKSRPFSDSLILSHYLHS